MICKLLGITVALMTLTAIIGGCASSPSAAELAKADYGAAPTDASGTVRAWLRMALKDPDSMKDFTCSPPTKTWITLGFGQFMYGWGCCAEYNAKNSFGGYVGRTPQEFLIKDNQVVAVTGGEYHFWQQLR